MRFITLFSLISIASFAGDNLAHEKLNKNEKKIKQELVRFLERCTLYPSYSIRIEKSNDNLTASELVSEAKKKVKHEFAPNPELRDDEIFPHGGDGELEPAHFSSDAYSVARNQECEASAKQLNAKYTIQGVTGKKKNQQIIGYVVQTKPSKQTTLFYLVSEQHVDHLDPLPYVEVGLKEDKTTVEDYDKLHLKRHFDSDAALVAYLENADDKDKYPMWKKQFAVARELIANTGGPYGDALKEGAYSTDPLVQWDLYKVSLKGQEPLDAVLFHEKDDGSYTVFFHQRSTKVKYIYYEN